jgi:hypothetical protein
LVVIREDYDGAEDYYLKALDADPKHAGNLGNYAHFLIAKGDVAQADLYIERAFEALGEIVSDGDKPLLAEFWFYRYAHYYVEWGEQAGRELTALLEQGVRSPGWDLEWDIELAQKPGLTHNPHLLEL